MEMKKIIAQRNYATKKYERFSSETLQTLDTYRGRETGQAQPDTAGDCLDRKSLESINLGPVSELI